MDRREFIKWSAVLGAEVYLGASILAWFGRSKDKKGKGSPDDPDGPLKIYSCPGVEINHPSVSETICDIDGKHIAAEAKRAKESQKSGLVELVAHEHLSKEKDYMALQMMEKRERIKEYIKEEKEGFGEKLEKHILELGNQYTACIPDKPLGLGSKSRLFVFKKAYLNPYSSWTSKKPSRVPDDVFLDGNITGALRKADDFCYGMEIKRWADGKEQDKLCVDNSNYLDIHYKNLKFLLGSRSILARIESHFQGTLISGTHHTDTTYNYLVKMGFKNYCKDTIQPKTDFEAKALYYHDSFLEHRIKFLETDKRAL